MSIGSVHRGSCETRPAGSKVLAFLNRFAWLASVPRRERRLRVCEMLSLGEKRFVAVIEYGQQKFLLAGTPQNISLLQRLNEKCGTADDVLRLEAISE